MQVDPHPRWQSILGLKLLFLLALPLPSPYKKRKREKKGKKASEEGKIPPSKDPEP